MEISATEYFDRAKKLYGEDPLDWKFVCTGCRQVQTGKEIVERMKQGVGSQRHGILKKGDEFQPDCECYQPKCNWVAYGLFSSNILVIRDPSKPHNQATKVNCSYHFPLADDQEMLKAAGIDKILDADGWPIGEKRQHCANCAKTRGKDCNRKKRVGIGFCRDWKAPVAELQPVGEQLASKGGN